MIKDIFDVFYSFATDYIKVWLILWGVMNIPSNKNKKVFYTILALQTIVIFISALFNHQYTDIVMFFRVLLVIFGVSLILKGKFFRNLAYSLLAYLLILLLDGFIIALSSLLINVSGYELLDSNLNKLLVNLANIVTIGIFVAIRKRMKKSRIQIHISNRIYALLFAGAATGFITLVALLIKSNDSTTEAARKLMVIATIVAAIAYNGACLMMIIITESRDNYKALSLINQSVIESQQLYYALVNEKQQEIRSIRHEMKNHMACIHALYQANNLPEMEHYISQLVEAAEITGDLFDTGNDIVNAILNDAQSRYKNDKIEIRLEGGFPEELYISPMDLCVIFANLTTNAIEAILRMDREKESYCCVDIKITSYKDDLFIDVKNPVDKNAEFSINKLITSKSDKNLHGFGVKNIIQRVEKYQGTANFRSENSQFSVEIHMKNSI